MFNQLFHIPFLDNSACPQVNHEDAVGVKSIGKDVVADSNVLF